MFLYDIHCRNGKRMRQIEPADPGNKEQQVLPFQTTLQ